MSDVGDICRWVNRGNPNSKPKGRTPKSYHLRTPSVLGLLLVFWTSGYLPSVWILILVDSLVSTQCKDKTHNIYADDSLRLTAAVVRVKPHYNTKCTTDLFATRDKTRDCQGCALRLRSHQQLFNCETEIISRFDILSGNLTSSSEYVHLQPKVCTYSSWSDSIPTRFVKALHKVQ